MKNTFIGYIYIVHNKLDLEKVYIGQTRTSLKQRWTQHKSAARNAKDNKIVFYNAINKYGENNFYIEELERIECKSKDVLIDKLNDLEIYYISLYNSVVPNGYNLTKGGGNVSIRNSKSVTSYFYNGTQDRTFESVADARQYYNADSSHILQCCNGKAQSCASRIWRYKGDSFNKYPITITEEQLMEGYNRKIDKYTMDGCFIKSYDSLGEAIKDDVSVKSHTPISYCCDGKYNQAYGYVWRDKGVPFDYYLWKENDCYSPVDVYDLDKNYLMSFDSISDAVKHLKLSKGIRAHITACCNGDRLSCGGYIWRRKGESLSSQRLERKIRKCQIYNRYDLNNNYIETIYGAKNLPQSSGAIYECCNGIRNYYVDSKWFYADDSNNPDKAKIIGEPKQYNTSNNLSCFFNKFIEPICEYDRYGNLLNKYNNAKELSKEKGIYTQIIYDVCDGKIAYNKNIVYRYEKDDFSLYYNNKYKNKHINVYDKNNNFICECFDIQECIRKLSLETTKGSSIQKCLSHDRKYAYGYRFFRVVDSSQPDKTKIIHCKE